MNTNTFFIATTFFLIGIVGGYLLGTFAHERRQGYDFIVGDFVPTGMHRISDGSLMPHGAMNAEGTNPMDHMAMMIVESEQEFIDGMIPHHQEAVDTAKEVILRGGTTPEIKALVENIVTAQEAEIAAMKSWYEAWYDEPYVDAGTYTPMMRDLTNLSGAELDRAFLEDMIMHHMGAIMMARSVQPYIRHQELADLTIDILETQTAEIAAMREMLETLP